MASKLKLILLMSLLSVMIISCNQENNDQPKVETDLDAKNIETPAIEKVEIKTKNVFEINSVSSQVADGMIDFTWSENGQEMKFSDLINGKAVLLNFWGTWCPPCRAEIPDIVSISNENSEQKLMVIGIALERERNSSRALEIVKKFAKDKNIEYKIFVDSKKELSNLYGKAFNPINGIPATFIFDSSYKLSSRLDGFQKKNQFMNAINKVL